MFTFWIDPSFLSFDAIAAALSGLVVFFNVLFCRPA